MEEKRSPDSSAQLGVSECWTAGGPLWINFANSRVLAGRGMPDVTGSQESLRWWFEVVHLQAPSRIGPDDLALASELRESFSRAIDSIGQGVPLSLGDIELFNSVLRKQNSWYELGQRDDGVIVRTALRSADTMEQALGPVIDSLSETLIHGDLTRLRTCAHPDCVLRFYDDSKSGTRRWCTMSSCGNRAKAAAFLQRKKVKG
jgi:predicted RNA-binding Zn ribbon-like protein